MRLGSSSQLCTNCITALHRSSTTVLRQLLIRTPQLNLLQPLFRNFELEVELHPFALVSIISGRNELYALEIIIARDDPDFQSTGEARFDSIHWATPLKQFQCKVYLVQLDGPCKCCWTVTERPPGTVDICTMA